MLTQEILKECYSYADVMRLLKMPSGTSSRRKAKKLCQHLDVSHFDPYKASRIRKYSLISKRCPVCRSKFTAQKGHPKEQKTCSYSCSNTYFRSGPKNPNWDDNAYRTTCFHYHGKKCWACEETRIVAVHHIDESHNNNEPSNLAPLCPTHHQYYHSEHKHLIEGIILEKQKEFQSKRATRLRYR